MSLLRLENLKTIYRTQKGDVIGNEEISFAVAAGKSFGLVGESGCGKSTLLKSIIGVLPENGFIAEGKVWLKGEELTALTEARMSRIRWKEISMITQSAMNALDPVYTVGYQITEAIKAHVNVDKRAARRQVEEMFELVGIDLGRYSEYPHQYSGGMRQRAIIAMSLILKPSLVIADEPTTSLDVIVQDQIFKNIKKLQSKIGFSLLLVTHDIALVVENCDDIAVMYGGRIMEIGPMRAVINTTFHPYTMGLKNAFPNIRNRKSELISIPGVPPSLLGELKGCRFVSRCPFAADRCRVETPALADVGVDHQAACHHLDRVDEMRTLAIEPDTWTVNLRD
jgi:oligopeptide/dipeptide ABC transporter ATP-binding protein